MTNINFSYALYVFTITHSGNTVIY